MNHYPYHIGDFDKDTRHLTRLERSVYRDLLDLYYDTEKRLPLDVGYLSRKVLATTNDESTAVERVLNEYFILTETGYLNVRCEIEIEKFRGNTSQKSAAGKASAEKKRLLRQRALNERTTGVQREGNGTSTNQNHKPEPRTKNHKPTKETGTDVPEFSSWFSTLWDSWPIGYGEKGSRKNAESVFMKLKPDKVLFTEMLRAVDAQLRHKQQSVGGFVSNFQHVERWLKNRRWEDEISRSVSGQRPLTRSEKFDQAADEAFGRVASGFVEGDFERINEHGIIDQS